MVTLGDSALRVSNTIIPLIKNSLYVPNLQLIIICGCWTRLNIIQFGDGRLAVLHPGEERILLRATLQEDGLY